MSRPVSTSINLYTHSKRGDYAIQRLIGLSPSGLIKLILTQVLSFVLYGLAVGTFLELLVTKLMFTIDEGSYDFVTLGVTSIVFLGATFAQIFQFISLFF
ncbi:FtsX-like permease family protein [Lysinibacillus sp. NPDC059133]|uniref:FtsX-like permease family protein n=1 Tax=Lysinibacillus sp. NPDC059133 TaxID=3346737 RepID=UPI0036C7B477